MSRKRAGVPAYRQAGRSGIRARLPPALASLKNNAYITNEYFGYAAVAEWHTLTTQNRVPKGVWVRVPPAALEAIVWPRRSRARQNRVGKPMWVRVPLQAQLGCFFVLMWYSCSREPSSLLKNPEQGSRHGDAETRRADDTNTFEAHTRSGVGAVPRGAVQTHLGTGVARIRFLQG